MRTVLCQADSRYWAQNAPSIRWAFLLCGTLIGFAISRCSPFASGSSIAFSGYKRLLRSDGRIWWRLQRSGASRLLDNRRTPIQVVASRQRTVNHCDPRTIVLYSPIWVEPV